MATIQPIEGRSVHHIQSGQVIVDLCSVVKELVENSLDAGATSIEVRFRNYGLQSIEVQDNGGGIAAEDFETIALKHYTSKLSSYDDLSSLRTFGFRGEALSSLCALSDFTITTAQAADAPKGSKLTFETSGKLKGTTVTACQKGTTVTVENIFRNLPVRKKELEKNIKREYSKVLGLLHAYACISVNTKFNVSNQPSQGKKVVAFSTKANGTTRENIANVYGAKTLLALVPLDLHLQMDPTGLSTQQNRHREGQNEDKSKDVLIVGHISRPIYGEGRQTPDRQMFFVNGRPCSLPQISKAINEVYKSYNVSQSAFIFADLRMDTEAYDVNVSPDKRQILLHDQTLLLEELKSELHKVFEAQDQSVPQAQVPSKQLPAFRPPTFTYKPSESMNVAESTFSDARSKLEARSNTSTAKMALRGTEGEQENSPVNLLREFVGRDTNDREDIPIPRSRKPRDTGSTVKPTSKSDSTAVGFRSAATVIDEEDEQIGWSSAPHHPDQSTKPQLADQPISRPVQDFNDRIASQLRRQKQDAPAESFTEDVEEEMEDDEIMSVATSPAKNPSGSVPNAFHRMRPQRTPNSVATITIGNTTTTTEIGNSAVKRHRVHTPKFDLSGSRLSQSSPLVRRSLRSFAAPGTTLIEGEPDTDSDKDNANTEAPTKAAGANSTLATSSITQTDESEMLDLDDTPAETTSNSRLFIASDEDSDDEYIDEDEKKAREEVKVAKLIALAEEAAARPTSDNLKRAAAALRGKLRKDATLQLETTIETSLEEIASYSNNVAQLRDQTSPAKPVSAGRTQSGSDDVSAEERLSLTVSKTDFARMRVVGQFNLGFILAVRPTDTYEPHMKKSQRGVKIPTDELFIIDQHASDEKFNFERLQSETIVQHQRLVQPKRLDLTAIEEEVILNDPDALLKNGFIVETDESGETPTGQRCSLTSLPMSREVVFDLRDLEELLALMGESAGSEPPRPSKVRKMFAMRACRGSIMIGKTLTKKQMEKVVRHMGEIDKPWNCPHGRPTMRHLYGLNDWKSWREGDGLMDGGDEHVQTPAWTTFLAAKRDGDDDNDDASD